MDENQRVKPLCGPSPPFFTYLQTAKLLIILQSRAICGAKKGENSPFLPKTKYVEILMGLI